MQSTLVRILGALFVLGLCAGAAQTQTKLTTLFAGNNGSITGASSTSTSPSSAEP
jgi:hypothetical protein